MRVHALFAAALVAASIAPAAGAQVRPDRDRETGLSSDFAPPIDLWLDQVSYDRGARMRPYFTTEPGAYVVVVRVTSDGELRVMYPSRPSELRPYVLGQFANDRIPFSSDAALDLHESTGTGFVFAIASYRRFDFTQFSLGRQWNTARLAQFGRYGDPFQIVNGFVDRILPGSDDFSLDYELYEVYSGGRRSAYGAGIYGSTGYWALSDYHDACMSAFGYRSTYYCRSYRGGYYGPIVIANPGRPRAPRGKVMKDPRPVVPDPLLPTPPHDPVPAEGRQATTDAADRAARDYYQRKLRSRADDPRVYSAPRTVDRGPRQESQPRAPVIYRTIPQSEPRSEPRAQAPQQPRAEPRAPARVEVRSEPRPQGTASEKHRAKQ